MWQRVISTWVLLFSLSAGVSAETSLHEVAAVDQGPGNITVTPDGRIILSLHQFFAPQMRVAELDKDGKLKAFPDPFWNIGDPEMPATLDSVLGIQSDTNGVVWMLDNGMRGAATPKLVGWDSRSNRLERIIYLPTPVTPTNAFVNDLAVDERHDVVYIADPAGGANAALIVVDLRTGLAHRLLEGHPSVVPEDIDLVIDGQPVRIKKPDGEIIRPRVGVNPIALDAQAEWLYFGPMHGTSLYRLATRDLLDESLEEDTLRQRVQRYSDKPICDGISIDKAGNIYISDVGNNAIGVIGTDRRYRLLVSDPRLSWPDAFSFGPDGYLYTVANQLHRTAVLSAGEPATEPPYRVLRFRPLAEGIAGR